jgi:hypothetical protein
LTGRDLELRELFDPDDLLDRWVFMLSATISDLAISEVTFKDVLFDSSRQAAHRFYLQRQLAGRIIEAWRVVGAIRDNERIAEFVSNAGGDDAAKWLLEKFARKAPGEKTEIELVFRKDREGAVHHPDVNSLELRATLGAAAEERTRIVRDHDAQRATIEFPEAAIARYMFGDPSGPAGTAALKRRAELAEEAFARFKELWDAVFPAQVARKGVNPARLYHEIGSKPRRPPRSGIFGHY